MGHRPEKQIHRFFAALRMTILLFHPLKPAGGLNGLPYRGGGDRALGLEV
jgi:hypothetical protein